MDFAFSEEQEQLRGFARDFLAGRYDDVTIARIADSETGVDAEVWPKLAELGWLDSELTFLDQAVLFEETGRGCSPRRTCPRWPSPRPRWTPRRPSGSPRAR